MAWRAPVLSAILTVDNFYEPFLDSAGEPIIIFPKPREVVHFGFSIGTLGATNTLDWEVLGGNRILTGPSGGFDAIGADLTWTTTTNANNDITFASAHHIFSTGDGPFRLTTSAADLPSGLAIATDYWLVVNDSTDIRFATSLANALVPTVIALADDGSGTHTLVEGGKGTLRLHLNTAADTQADDYYNELYIHIKSGSANATFRKIGDYDNASDVAYLLHSSDGVVAAGNTYDIYAMSQIIDAAASITTVVATAPVEASPMEDEFGVSGYPVLIPRARASGGADAHKVLLAYTIDGVDA